MQLQLQQNDELLRLLSEGTSIDTDNTSLPLSQEMLQQFLGCAATGFLGFVLVVGTGGTPRPQIHPTTVPRIIVSAPREESRGARLGSLSIRQMLICIRDFFNFSVSDLARLLLVERPTIYSWLSGSTAPQRANLVRLSTFFEIAEDVREQLSQTLTDGPRLTRANRELALEALGTHMEQPKIATNRLYAMFVSDRDFHLARTNRPSLRDIANRHGMGKETPGDERAFERETLFQRG